MQDRYITSNSLSVIDRPVEAREGTYDVDAILRSPQPMQISRFPSHVVDRLDASLTDNRVSLQISPTNTTKFLSEWYQQSDGTCSVWAVANALHSGLGVDLNSASYREFLVALQERALREGGLNSWEIKAEARKRRNSLGIEFVSAEKFGYKPPVRKELFFHVSVGEMQEANAKVLINQFAKGNCLIASVDPSLFYGIEDDGSMHAIVIVDYRVNKNGFMDIKIIDSNYGAKWVGFEFFSSHAKDLRVVRRI